VTSAALARVAVSSQSKIVTQKKNKIKFDCSTTRMRLGPQDALVGGAAAVGQGGSAPATPTQQDRMFGATENAAAEFRIKVSSQMSFKQVDTQEGSKIKVLSA